ncbi:MAG TPA: hypothetical protein VL984_04685 [Acidimicrobiales bacterium]|nr:hypothetical protein [Acidimicrobiales bacterium]
MKPRLEVASVAIYDRRLASGFIRPCTVTDVAEVITEVPPEYLSGLAGVYLLGGTVAQMRRTTRTFGMYHEGSAYLFPVPATFLEGFPIKGLRPSSAQRYEMAGAAITTGGRSGVDTLRFDAESLRIFYLYDVLLHEIGHHIDGGRSRGEVERFAHWFSDYQRSRLLH